VVIVIVVGAAVVVVVVGAAVVVVVVGAAVVVVRNPVRVLDPYLTVLEFSFELDATITAAKVHFNLDARCLLNLDTPSHRGDCGDDRETCG
ncbi:MAG: hypothetical protein ABFR53_01645, partial [Actinomycetota bacterium]